MQDRLINEMPLSGVRDIVGAQAFAEKFIELWNTKFARPPSTRIGLGRKASRGSTKRSRAASSAPCR